MATKDRCSLSPSNVGCHPIGIMFPTLFFSPFSFHNEVSKPCSLLPEINFLLSKKNYSLMLSACNSILILEGCRIIEMEQERVKSITGRVIQGGFHMWTDSVRGCPDATVVPRTGQSSEFYSDFNIVYRLE